MTAKLTRMFDDVAEDGAAKTPAGMAFWKGSGPKGVTCRECRHWAHEKPPKRYRADAATHGKGELMPAGCAEWKRLMRHEDSWPKLKHHTPCCKYIDRSSEPPAAFDRKTV